MYINTYLIYIFLSFCIYTHNSDTCIYIYLIHTYIYIIFFWGGGYVNINKTFNM